MSNVTDLPRAVLIDIDGTLALRDEQQPDCRRFYDWHRVGEDLPNKPVVELVRLVAAAMQHEIILMSGRDAVCRTETVAWLDKHDIPWHQLHMCPERGRFAVAFVVDDRDQVVDLWRRELGLPCFQVNYGAF